MKLIKLTNASDVENLGNKELLINPEHVAVVPQEVGETRLYIRDGVHDPENSGPWTVKETFEQVKNKFIAAGVEIV